MDFQFWIYVIVVVIYVLSRALKKQETPPEQNQDPQKQRRQRAPDRPDTGKPRPLTFEELLREITEAKEPPKPVYQAPPRPVYVPEKKSEVVDYDDEIPEEEQDLETIDNDYRKKDKIYDVYEEAKKQAFSRPSLEETMSVNDTVIRFGKFRAFEQEERSPVLASYTKDLHDPEGLKKAFVLTEILNRKF